MPNNIPGVVKRLGEHPGRVAVAEHRDLELAAGLGAIGLDEGVVKRRVLTPQSQAFSICYSTDRRPNPTPINSSGANSYFRRFCANFLNQTVNPKELNLREQRALIERAQEEIFDFPSWNDVLEACGLAETETERPKPKRRRPRRSGWSTGPESEAHKSLKRQVAENPALVGLKSNENGKEEIPLWSGDRVDVLFE